MKKLIIVLISSLFVMIVSFKLDKYHKYIYKFHCDNFYDFDSHLSEYERKYIQYCIRNAKYEYILDIFYKLISSFIPKSNYCYSYITFSHDVVGETINSSRVSMGTKYFTNQYLKEAYKVLNEKKLIIDNDILSTMKFGGLGWDCEKSHFKVYFIFLNKNLLPHRYKKIIDKKYFHNNYKNEGILSITYLKNNCEYEKKIYIYPKINEECAYLTTSKGRNITQLTSKQININAIINDTGKHLLDKYYKIGLKPDTINIKDKNNYILYFPH